jgi:putative SOS response-associated peptidase YedK
MCGRFTLLAAPETVRAQFDLEDAPSLSVRYNVAPTQEVASIRYKADENTRECVFLRWGLVPSWANDATIGNRLINARSETVVTKPAFRAAFRRRRCLIVADGFYEWQAHGRKKQPYHFKMRDRAPFGIAGLWECWQLIGETPLESCTLLTTTANDVIRPAHDRMPVIVPASAYALWLDPAVQTPERLLPLLTPYPAQQMDAQAVSPIVNSPRHEGPECLAPVLVPTDLPFG